MSEWKIVDRVVHLHGGLRAISKPGPQVKIVPALPDKGITTFNIADFAALFDHIAALGLRVVGCDYYSAADQINGLREPTWIPMMPPLNGLPSLIGHPWPAQNILDTWRCISNEAAERDSMSVFEKSRHISTQIDICWWSLRDLSDAYHRHLLATCRDGSFKEVPGYAGSFSQFIFHSAHSMFAELASLRDHLAMFAARDILGIVGQKIDDWTRLINSGAFKKSAHPLAASLRNQGQWLDLFTEYRNLFVHNAPMGAAEGAAFVRHAIVSIPPGLPLPSVALALPSDPAAIRARLRSETALRSYEHWLEIAKERNSGPDALFYLHDTFTNMLRLAAEVAQYSPVPPVVPNLRVGEEIIGKIEVTRNAGPI